MANIVYLDGIARTRNFRKEFGFLSCMYDCNFTLSGHHFTNAEKAFQARKTIIEEERNLFFSLGGPKEAKALSHRCIIRPDWDHLATSSMYFTLLAKFFQDEALMNKLIETGRRGIKLEEGNTWHDQVWGVDIETREGTNKLGKVLTKVRRVLSDMVEGKIGREDVAAMLEPQTERLYLVGTLKTDVLENKTKARKELIDMTKKIYYRDAPLGGTITALSKGQGICPNKEFYRIFFQKRILELNLDLSDSISDMWTSACSVFSNCGFQTDNIEWNVVAERGLSLTTEPLHRFLARDLNIKMDFRN